MAEHKELRRSGDWGRGGLHGYGQTNWDDLLIEGIFGPRTPLSRTLPLWPCEAATGWLQLTDCWWETAVGQPTPPPPCPNPTSRPPPSLTTRPLLNSTPAAAASHDKRHFLWETKGTFEVTADRKKVRPSQPLCTFCACVCVYVRVCVIDRLIRSYYTDSNRLTHLFLLLCEVQVSPQDSKSLDHFPVVL